MKVYYTPSNIPKKFLNRENISLKEGYSWDEKNRLLKDGVHVIKNEKKLNTPRYFQINFQAIYSGNMHPATRSKIVKWFHNYWKEQIQQDSFKRVLLKSDEVIIVKFHYFDLVSNVRPDFIDNFCFLYKKTFMDTIVEEGYLKDDSLLYVRGDENKFFEIENENERRLEITTVIVNKKTLL